VSAPVAGRGSLRSGWVRLSGALVLYRIRLRRRWFQELLAVLGIALGVALLYATQVASTSLSGPVRSLNAGLVGNSQLQLISRGGTGMPQAIYDQLVGLPGVRRAAPVLEKPGNLVGPRGQEGVTFIGGDPRVLTLRGNLLQGFSRRDAAQQESIVIPAPVAREIGVRMGDDVEVQVDGRRTIVPAVVAGRKQIGSPVNASIALVPLAYLQRLSRSEGLVTRILVETQPGHVAAVRARLHRLGDGRADVRPADYETRLFDAAARPTSQASALFSVLSALIGWLFAVCALLVTAAERRKLAAQQREQGFAPSATLTTLLVDAAIIGLVGSTIGLVAGELLSRHGFSSDVSYLSGAFPIGDQRVVTWQSVAIAMIGGLVASVVGVLGPVREVVAESLPRRLRPKPVRGPQEARRRRIPALPTLGAVCLIAAIAITIVAPAAAIVGLLLLALALLMLLPILLAGAIRGLEWCNRRDRSIVSVELALQQLREARWRSRALAIAATGAVAVFGATALQGARLNLQGGLGGSAAGMAAAADIWAAPAGAGSALGTSSFGPTATATAALARLPGVASIGLYHAGLLDVAGRRAFVLGEPIDVAHPIPPGQMLDGDGQLAARRVRFGGWATISEALADSLGVRIGQPLVLPTPRPIDLRVAGITSNLGWSSGAIVLNAPDFARAWGSDAIAAYHVRLAQHARAADVAREVKAALGPHAALQVETAEQRTADQRAVARSGLSRLSQIAGLSLFAAVLAMSAAMIGLLWQHRPSVAERKQHGLSSALMWRSLVVETVVLFGTGALAGGVFGLLGQALCTRGLEAFTGFPVIHDLRLDVAGMTTLLVIASSALVVIVPGYLVARVRPSWRG
jgi:putative ABC transport system permease protein